MADDRYEFLARMVSESKSREEMAEAYKDALVESHMSGIEPDWPTINIAIRNRWSLAGLDYIKKGAWKRIAKMQGPGPVVELDEEQQP